MSALTVILTLWASLAFGAILFIRGATSRVEPPARPGKRSAARLSLAE